MKQNKKNWDRTMLTIDKSESGMAISIKGNITQILAELGILVEAIQE